MPAPRPPMPQHRRVGPNTPARKPIGYQQNQGRERAAAEANNNRTGYENLDAWNALPPADQARIRSHSTKLLNAFRFTKWFLKCLGIFPFSAKKLEDGSYTFTMSRCSVSYIILMIVSVIHGVIFVLFTLGFVCMFLNAASGGSLRDRCGNTWGRTVLSRNMPAVVFVWTELMLTTAGNVHVLIHGQRFLEFYNCVNQAVMQLDVDPTTGMRKNDIKGFTVFGTLFVVCFVVFASGVFTSLEDVSAFVIQAIGYFFVNDLVFIDEEPFWARKAIAVQPKCDNVCKDCLFDEDREADCKSNGCFNSVNRPAMMYRTIKWAGFLIFAYSFMAARALIRQFEFFCQVLVNLASVWNKRFLNYTSKDNSISMDDPYRRRISAQYMMKDHYKIVHLYNETEANFSLILFAYYASIFFNLICQFYYTALLSTQVTCNDAVLRERKAAEEGLCYANASVNINVTKLVLQHGSRNSSKLVSFEDPCIRVGTYVRHSSMTAIVLLLVTIISFIKTTLDADRASHQADVGFYRVRKSGYMTCRTKKERNAMHSLVFSFTGPKPFCITAAGFFSLRKKTVVVVISVAFVYFLIILSFKPGMNVGEERCFNFTKNGRRNYIVKYPKVI